MKQDKNNTAAWVSIEDVHACATEVDTQITEVLGQILAQRRSATTAFDYIRALGPGVKANCWTLAEAAGHEGWHRMQALLGAYRWDYRKLRDRLATLAAAWLPHEANDLIGPGIAIDETAALKRGDATAAVAPQHAGCTGKVENCVTTVFTAYVTSTDQTWVDFDIYLPKRWANDPARRTRAGVPEELGLRTKPQLAIDQLDRLIAIGLPIRWVAFDEVYGRSSALRQACEDHGLAYVAIVPRDFQITTGPGTPIRADETPADAVFERRSAGTGSKGRRWADWALIATASPHHHLLIRRLVSRPDQYTFYLCHAPAEQPATMTFFVMVSGRRWPIEETFATGKDVLGWDQSQARTFTAQGRHTTLAALAQLRQAAIRARVHGTIPTPSNAQPATEPITNPEPVNETDLRIPIGDSPIPTNPDQPLPPNLGLIRLTVAETARLADLAADWSAGLITRAHLAFKLRWSARRRRHQATARWHHHTTRLARP